MPRRTIAGSRNEPLVGIVLVDRYETEIRSKEHTIMDRFMNLNAECVCVCVSGHTTQGLLLTLDSGMLPMVLTRASRVLGIEPGRPHASKHLLNYPTAPAPLPHYHKGLILFGPDIHRVL